MKKYLIVIGMTLILLAVGLSGCNEIIPSGEKTLPDGTKIKGDIGSIDILNYVSVKWKTLSFLYYPYNREGKILSLDIAKKNVEVPWTTNISDIDTNLSKRKFICDTYLSKEIQKIGSNNVEWNDDYTVCYPWGISSGSYFTRYDSEGFEAGTQVSSWSVSGTVKNIGDSFLDYTMIVVNFYNVNGSWLASNSDGEDNIPVGYTWDFSIRYNGEFRNDVSYISFEVETISYDH